MIAFNYILRSVLPTLFLCIASFFSLIFTFQFIQNSELFLQDKSTSYLVLKILGILGISYLPLIIPFCLLFAILVGYGKLSSNSEFTAFSALGISKFSLSLPAIFLGFVCFLVCLSSVHSWGPNSRFLSNSLKTTLQNQAAMTAFQPGIFFNQFENYTLYSESQNPSGELANVFLLNTDNESTSFIFSKSGNFYKNENKSLGFKLNDGVFYSILQEKQEILKAHFQNYTVNLFNFISDKQNTGRPLSSLTSKQLKSDLKESSLSEEQRRETQIEIHKRNVFSLSCLLFLVVALLLSLRIHNRSSKSSGVFLALIVGLSFWITLFISEYMAYSTGYIYFVYFPVFPFILFSLLYYILRYSKSVI